MTQALNVLRQGIADQSTAAFFRRNVHKPVPVEIGELTGADLDVLPVIAVLRELHSVLALVNLEIAGFQRQAEFFNLIAGVVHIKFAGYVKARRAEYRSQAVAQSAAPCVADVHRAGWVGGDKFDHVLFAVPIIGTAVFLTLFRCV